MSRATVNDPSPSPAEPGPRRWFLVANGSRARAYVQRIGTPGYDVAREWDAPEARLGSHVLGEDRPGRVFAAAGATQRSGIEEEDPAATPKGHAKHAFLEALAEAMTEGLRGGAVSAFTLVAPARLLHRLRDALPEDVRHALVGAHAGDFTQAPTADVFHLLDGLRHAPEPAMEVPQHRGRGS